MIIYVAADKQKPENKNIVPWNSSVSVSKGKYLIIINEHTHKTIMQNVCPKSFNFSGMISEITRKGNVKTAHDAMKQTNEKLTIGIKLTDST